MRLPKWWLSLSALTLSVNSSYAAIFFDDISISSGVHSFQAETWGAAVGDLNNDGYPDIHITNHVTPSVLLRNNGNKTFTDVSLLTDTNKGWIEQYSRKIEEHSAAWGDYDNDGDLDLATAHNFDSAVYENRGGTLHNLGKDLHWHRWRIQSVWFDEDNDGLLDLGLSGSVGKTSGSLFRNNNLTIPENQTSNGRCSFNLLTISDFNVDGKMDYTCGIYPQEFTADGRYYTIGGQEHSGLPSHKPIQDAISADFNGDLRPDLFMLRGALRPSDGYQDGSDRIEFHVTADGNNPKTVIFATSGVINLWVDWNRGDGANQSCQPLYLGADGHTSDGTNATNIPGRFSEIELTLDPADSKYHGLKYYTGCGAALGYFPSLGVWKLKLGGQNSHHMFATVEANSGVTFQQIENTGINHGVLYPKYYLNLNNGYQDKSFVSGLEKERCASVVAGDLDNDMDLDLYLACRGGSHNLANVVYENLGDGTFARVINHGGEGSVGPTWADGNGAGNSDSAVLLDMDLDGFLDIFVTNGLNLRPNEGTGRYNMLRNKGNANHWLLLDLQGVQSNRDGIGAKIFATTPDGKVQLREQNGGYHRWSQNHMRIHFGLAGHNTADLRIEWPSGTVDVLTNISSKQLLTITEGSSIATVKQTSKPSPYPCGKPDYTPSSVAGVYIWKNCRNGMWNLRAIAGNQNVNYQGTLILDAASSNRGSFVNFAKRNIEPSDSVELIDTHHIAFNVLPSISDEDGFSFALDNLSHLACLTINANTNNFLYVGAQKQVLDAQNGINIKTMTACAGASSNDNDGDGLTDDIDPDDDNDGVSDIDDAFPLNTNESNDNDLDGIGDNQDSDDDNDGTLDSDDAFPFDATESKDSDADGIGDNSDPFPFDPTNGGAAAAACGEPQWSKNQDRGTFIWKDCINSNQPWTIRVTGGGTNASLLYEGQITAVNGISNRMDFSIENNDVLDSNGDTTNYQLRIYSNGVDGFSFNAPASTCIKFNGPLNLPVYIGMQRQTLTTVSRSINLDDLQECVAHIDSDNDGLSDQQEILLGTDINNSDTDGGGVSDGDEVNAGKNPLDASDDATDSDGDGLSDSDELIHGTDAANPDTDGERLSDGDEVNIYHTDPLRPNTDKDGLSDWAEVKIIGTDPLKADTDDDGLSDGDERKTLLTDPLKADTDGGGTDDGVEITNGSNPLDPSDD